MFSSSIYLLLLALFITRIKCQTNSIPTNLGTCACDLKKGTCDLACCCDVDCSADERKAFQCDSQSTCFHNIPIYKSNAPHVVQKKGDRICVDYQQNDQTKQILHEEIDASALPRSINVENSVPAPPGTVANLSVYQAGSPVFRYILATTTPTYFTLPVPLFNSLTCAGSQPITYMKDFSSTCNQIVNADTCANELNPARYANLYLFKRSSLLTGTTIATTDYVPCSSIGTIASSGSQPCTNAISDLTLTIYYANPDGIQSCSVVITPTTTSGALVRQTFSVRFLKFGSSVPITTRSGNPGYLPGVSLIAGNLVGNVINRASGLTILQASNTGNCAGTNNRVITFGVNVQSTCLYTLASAGTCPTIAVLLTAFAVNDINNLYVAIKGNPDTSTITDNWIRVRFCTSTVGSTSEPVCQENSIPNPPTGQCYTRLDIQITYANFGSVTNPQPIIGAVTYYFQSVSIASTRTTLPLIQSVTFQDVSYPPMTEGDQVPRPNTRLPGDFFYPFSLSRAGSLPVFSYLSIISLLSLLFLL